MGADDGMARGGIGGAPAGNSGLGQRKRLRQAQQAKSAGAPSALCVCRCRRHQRVMADMRGTLLSS